MKWMNAMFGIHIWYSPHSLFDDKFSIFNLIIWWSIIYFYVNLAHKTYYLLSGKPDEWTELALFQDISN